MTFRTGSQIALEMLVSKGLLRYIKGVKAESGAREECTGRGKEIKRRIATHSERSHPHSSHPIQPRSLPFRNSRFPSHC